jgi:uncharacterized protein
MSSTAAAVLLAAVLWIKISHSNQHLRQDGPMELHLFITAAFGLFFAGIIKGATGLGYASCALPFLVPAVGLKPAIALLIIPTIVSNLQVVLTAGFFQETLGRFSRLYIAMIPGIILGVTALKYIDVKIATAVLGSVITVYAAFAILSPAWRMSSAAERRWQVPVGLLNGFITGLTGSQVMPLFPYIMSLGLDSNRLVQAINLTVTLATTIMAVSLAVLGLVTATTVLHSLLAIVPAMTGVALGGQVRRHIPSTHFRVLVLAVLFAMGCGLVYSSLR